MKNIRFLFSGILFGIILTKGEIISWYRIYEMFRFESFHMYGVIGSAVVLGIIVIATIKKMDMKSLDGEKIVIPPKAKGIPHLIFGGIIFGLGWALTGACPGPLYTLVGNGFSVIIVTVLSAIFGAFVYGLLKNKLPH